MRHVSTALRRMATSVLSGEASVPFSRPVTLLVPAIIEIAILTRVITYVENNLPAAKSTLFRTNQQATNLLGGRFSLESKRFLVSKGTKASKGLLVSKGTKASIGFLARL